MKCFRPLPGAVNLVGWFSILVVIGIVLTTFFVVCYGCVWFTFVFFAVLFLKAGRRNVSL